MAAKTSRWPKRRAGEAAVVTGPWLVLAASAAFWKAPQAPAPPIIPSPQQQRQSRTSGAKTASADLPGPQRWASPRPMISTARYQTRAMSPPHCGTAITR